MYYNALEYIVEKKKASASLLQRVFRIGYNRASRIMEEFERQGFVSKEDGAKPRKVLVTQRELDEYRKPK
jgi:S-DNA-T family DNA segregation ATPase FtsK/SpoIIIE